MVASDALIDPTRATTVRFTDGAPVPTDGPFAEIKESLAGYWLIEASHERAVEIASGWWRTPSIRWRCGGSWTNRPQP